MLNRSILKVELVIRDHSLAWLADKLSMSRTTFYRRMRDGSFTIDEAQRICELLGIEDPCKMCDIFFAHDVPKVGQTTEATE